MYFSSNERLDLIIKTSQQMPNSNIYIQEE